MPLNIVRLNQRHAHPTPNIVFIKPLPGPDAAQAEAFLYRVAAICHPILTKNHISVTTMEEYEPNREFIGRNFNAGECVQLVLRTRGGGWLPFKSVVMVAMHELAHCKQMNHSRAFWAVRNQYAEEMKALWVRGYTGEGIWGRGRELELGDFEIPQAEWGHDSMPEQLCGGTFRSRGRGKRKRVQLSYAEREKRRIAKKFGANGSKLGEDDGVKFFLDGGKKIAGKPRVAASNRGRELRAQAALIRFGAQNADADAVKKEEETVKQEPEDVDFDDYEDEDIGKLDALDLDGKTLRDSKGQPMIKVCEDEDKDDMYVKREMDELNDLWSIPEAPRSEREPATTASFKAQGRPGESFYAASSTTSNNKPRPSSPTPIQQTKTGEDMRSKLDAFHTSGSIVNAFKKQDKRARPKK